MDVQYITNIVVVTPDVSTIDITNSEQVGTEIEAALGTHRSLVFDLTNVQFIDSSGLGKIVSLVRTCTDDGGGVAVCNVQRSVMVLFDMVKLNQIVTLADDRDAAIRSVRSETT